ncbi:MHS family MFS transporter [Rhodococcus sp. ZPP]|uniref:MFS transporter n=1 Tax=Rhodococcus sp. ZPP TaxID=2749906 RepID=UPI001AD885C8|nr:MFS transporter [Rhodococcus sp. ZPP]QTJ66840.1 MHS family MFS transporter [Rhodococcus sp. ZPP]
MTGSRPAQQRKVFGASAIGTTIEWYDFFVYATAAALVFSSQFFGAMDPAVALLTSMATIGVTFIARPFGSAVVGHFGDKIGRKEMLVLTLALMGISTFLVGLLPTYAQIGIWAPILLVFLRFLQGISAGGEWAGAALMAVEHAPANKRGLWGGSVQIGTPVGLVLATGSFLLVAQFTTEDEFLSWGWRVPFFVSILLVAIGYYVRTKIDESPEFRAMKAQSRQESAPIIDIFRQHKRPLVIGTLTFLGTNMAGYMIISFLLSYATNILGIDRTDVLLVQVVGSVFWVAVILATSYLTDRVGGRALFIAGFMLQVLVAVPCMLLVGTGRVLLMYPAALLLIISLGLTMGPQSAVFVSLFPTRVRYSGASLAYAFGAILGGGPAPFVATYLVQRFDSPFAVGLYIAGAGLISLCAALAIRRADLVGLRHGPEAAKDPSAHGDDHSTTLVNS